MLRTVLLMSVTCLLAFTSCKKTGTTKACFKLSKEKAKIGDTVYLLNCSENYSKFIWLSPSGLFDSIDRHTYVVPAATGAYDIFLYVGPNEFTSANYADASVDKKSITVE